MKKRDLYTEWLNSMTDDEFLCYYNDLPKAALQFNEWLLLQSGSRPVEQDWLTELNITVDTLRNNDKVGSR
jgi:hypothetical protein